MWNLPQLKKKKAPKGLVGPHITRSSFLAAGIRGCSIRPALEWLFFKSTWRKEEDTWGYSGLLCTCTRWWGRQPGHLGEEQNHQHGLGSKGLFSKGLLSTCWDLFQTLGKKRTCFCFFYNHVHNSEIIKILLSLMSLRALEVKCTNR